MRTRWDYSVDRVVPSGLVLIGLFAILLDDQIVDMVIRLVPHRFLHRTSPVTGEWAGFAQRGDSIVRSTGVVLAVAGVAGMVRWPQNALAILTSTVRDNFNWWMVSLSAAVGVFMGWLAAPVDKSATHFIYHWVLEVHSPNPVRRYFTPQLIHGFFYDHPAVWQGINWAVIAFVLTVIGRRLLGPHPLALGLGASVAISGNMLFFVSSDEDVSIVVLVAVLAIHAVLTRRALWTGVAFTLAVATRPDALVLPIALACALAAQWFLDRKLKSIDKPKSQSLKIGSPPTQTTRELTKYSAQSLAWFGTLFFLFQAFLTVESQRWFLVGGDIIRLGRLATREPRNWDGFTIYPLSGTYFGHALWTFPVVLTGAVLIGVILIRRVPHKLQFPLIFTAASALGWILVNEIQVILFYSVRHLTYSFPFLLIGAWIAFAATRERVKLRRSGWAVSMLVLLLLAPAAVPYNAIQARAERAELPWAGYGSDRETIQEVTGDECIVVFGTSQVKKLLLVTRYVFETFHGIRSTESFDEASDSDCSIIALTSDASTLTTTHHVLWTDGSVVVLASAGQTQSAQLQSRIDGLISTWPSGPIDGPPPTVDATQNLVRGCITAGNGEQTDIGILGASSIRVTTEIESTVTLAWSEPTGTATTNIPRTQLAHPWKPGQVTVTFAEPERPTTVTITAEGSEVQICGLSYERP